jgi:hypothetical protein
MKIKFSTGLLAFLILGMASVFALDMTEITRAVDNSQQRELGTNEWLVIDLAAGETVTVDFAVSSGSNYALYVVDDYNADRHPEAGVDSAIEAVWFMVLRPDNTPYDPDSEPAEIEYDYAELTSLYDAVGGYTPDGSRAPAANFSAIDGGIRVYIEGSKTSYEGQMAIRLERSR